MRLIRYPILFVSLFVVGTSAQRSLAVASNTSLSSNRPRVQRSRIVRVREVQPTFVVTNTLDSSSGSLRSVIDEVNRFDGCKLTNPCRIAFQIGESPENGLLTIVPATPLPALTRTGVVIDGASQREFGGDTNPMGPEIQINGAACGECNGLSIHPGESGTSFVVVSGVIINGFAGDGIHVTGGDKPDAVNALIDGCYIGTDGTGTRAVPNGRGIYAENAALDVGFVTDNRIVRPSPAICIVSGNSGDGINFVGGHAFIDGNHIGTDRSGFVPLANGGDGIRSSGDSTIQHNVIAFNRDRGVSILKPLSINVLTGNLIHSNALLGIDIGDDGVTENGVPGVADVPIITSARATGGETRISFRQATPPNGLYTTVLEFFNSSFTDATGHGEGRSILTDTFSGSIPVRHGDEYEIVVPKNLSGKFISATANFFYLGVGERFGASSEFSKSVQVTTGDCPTLSPMIQQAVPSPGGATTFKWSALTGANEYRIWVMRAGDEPRIAYQGVANEVTLSLPAGTEWWVEARFDPCYGTQSEHSFVPADSR